MRGLATLAMQGRSRATMVATALLLLSLIMPPLSLLSAGVVALVTLRRGALEGGVVLALSLLATGLLGALALGAPSAVVLVAVLVWLPVWLLAVLLHHLRALPLVVVAAMLLALVVLAAGYAETGDPVAQWRQLLGPFTQSLVEAELIQPEQQQGLLEALSGWMPGMIASGFFVQSLLSLFLGRWWQALLFNPGGFREEFHGLRLPRWLAGISLLVWVWALAGGIQPGLASYLAMLLISVWLFQGLALLHFLVARVNASVVWLVVVYGLLFFAMLYMSTALAVLGFADTWVDFRARLGDRQGPDEAG